MSRFNVEDEAVVALLEGFALELKALAPSQAASDHFLGENFCNFYSMIVSFGKDAFAGVTRPASGTGKPVLCLVISDEFRRHATLCAKRCYGIPDH